MKASGIAPAGSTLWLLRHEMRLTWRGLVERRGRGRFARIWLMAGLPVLMLVVAGVPLGLALRDIDIPIVPLAGVMATLALMAFFTLMLSQTLGAAVEALYDRADLDLLFSSPIRPRRVMTVRFLGVAASVFTLFGIVLTPILLPIAVLGHPGWLAALVVLFSIALAASGAGLLVAAGLFRLIGPRRTRTIGQVLAALIGAAFFLAAQARNILGGAKTGSVWLTFVQLTRDPRFHPPGWIVWPLRALVGEPLPLLSVVAAGAGVFALACWLLGGHFASDAAAAAGAGAGRRRTARAVRVRFADGPFAATLRKEVRLLLRDPALITQVLLRVLYMVPLGFVLLRQSWQGQNLYLPGGAAALGMMAGQVTASLSWITVSAEDAPDLLACAPAPIRMLRRAKIAAACAPVAGLLLPILAPLALFAPWVAFVAALGCAAQMAMGALLNLWWQRPGKRSEFRRRRTSAWYVTLAEIVLGLLIAAATGLFAAGLGWGMIPAALALAGVMLMRRTDAQIAEALRLAR